MTDPMGMALAALRRGDAIGLPTDTVYGLAADASRPEAVRRPAAGSKGTVVPRWATAVRNGARLSRFKS